MPCYQTVTMRVDFDPKKPELLRRTLKELNWRIDRFEVGADGKLSLKAHGGRYGRLKVEGGVASGQANAVNLLRVAYSQTLVTVAEEWARQQGWAVARQGDTVSLKKGGL